MACLLIYDMKTRIWLPVSHFAIGYRCVVLMLLWIWLMLNHIHLGKYNLEKKRLEKGWREVKLWSRMDKPLGKNIWPFFFCILAFLMMVRIQQNVSGASHRGDQAGSSSYQRRAWRLTWGSTIDSKREKPCESLFQQPKTTFGHATQFCNLCSVCV